MLTIEDYELNDHQAITMGLGLRIFLITEDDSLRRLSGEKFQRLRRGEPEERLPEYANKQLRYALVVLETEHRKPVAIHMVQYAYLFFDAEGTLDRTNLEQAARLALDMVPPAASDINDEWVIDARHRFAKKRYHDQYKWTPTPELEAAIVRAVLGKAGG
jgi:hypothetical protein